MKGGYEKQLDRVRRYLRRIDPPNGDHGSQMEHEDNLWSFFQNAWHLKDWIKNDQSLVPIDIEDIVKNYDSLMICADLANGTKHLELRSPRRGAKHARTSIAVQLGQAPAS